ncbi:6-phosphofructokinase [Aliidiomarina haloalkalitolerans]|uniref:6-phosphofructokinase n=1 Tax=Aliidiomarina haloalkalitolerans TaxID=859059 RepID=A0A432VTV9_9GAMM|nr:ATP-dependent 6-phosphofructokinase [Aliidiomarina haloalkalitolerans]MCL4409477.1 ATP-dependent 6-phosphofructokinase [Gammaproteobacteria bacterium]RUO19907.1 ATP-dependent 6-phosphofructokinase [Aliidiomarina haloalkalitolerans]
MKKIAVITSGGDAPGMNACIRAIVNTAWQHDLEVIGFRHGFRGIVEDLNVPLHPDDMRLVSQRGGTFLKSSRFPEFREVDVAKKAAQVLDQHDISALVVIGGDGSFRGAHHLNQYWGGQVIGVPGTIDNDLAGTDVTIGFATAVDTAMDAIDKVRETAEAMARVFIIEVMGRHAGFIGLHAAIAAAAEAMILPELEPQPKLAELADGILQARAAFPDSSYVVILSENLWPGGVHELSKNLSKATGVTCHPCPLGHIQRGGRPNAQDRILAMQLGAAAVDAILSGKTAMMIGLEQEHVVHVPLHLTFERDKPLDARLVQLQLGLQGVNITSKTSK